MDDEIRARFDRLDALMARMDRLREVSARDREDLQVVSRLLQVLQASTSQLLDMTTVLHRRLTEAEQTIDDLRKAA